MGIRWFALIVTCIALGAPTSADAGCSVLSLEGQTLAVDEIEPGAWDAALEATTVAFNRAKTAGDLFDHVYAGGYKVQQVRADLETFDAEWNEALAAARTAALPFEGTCAGEFLADILRKAVAYREPEIGMVNSVLGGKPLKASQKTLHDARNQDYREYERRYLGIVNAATVSQAFEAPPVSDELPPDTLSMPPEASPTQ
jgi:hypothetical protein